MLKRGVAWLLVVCSATFASHAAAQPSAQDRALARGEFRRGNEAAERGDWETALEAFTAAYTAVPRPEILLNLGTAQAETGRVVAASESYERFIRDARGTRLEAHIPRAEEALAEVQARIGHITITLEGAADDDRVMVDGASYAHVGRPAPFDPTPRSHRVEVLRDGEVIASRVLSVAPGERAEETLRLESSSATAGHSGSTGDGVGAVSSTGSETLDDDDDDDGGGGVLSSPVFWTIVAVLVVGGAAAGIAVAATSGSEDPFVGNLGSGSTTVR